MPNKSSRANSLLLVRANPLLLVPTFTVMAVMSFGAIWLIQRLQSLRCPAGTFLVGSGAAMTILQAGPILIASTGVGLVCANWFAHLISQLRRLLDGGAKRNNKPHRSRRTVRSVGTAGHAGPHGDPMNQGMEPEQRLLMRLSLTVMLAMLPVSMAASLSQYCLLSRGILYQPWPWTGLQSYSWHDVVKIETKCRFSKSGWYGSYLLIMGDDASVDLMKPWGSRSLASVYPQVARALDGAEFTFDSEGVNPGCDLPNVELLRRRP